MMDTEGIRHCIYRTFAETGRPPDIGSVAAELGLEDIAVVRGLRELARERHIVLDSEDRVVMAHPFSAIPLGFSVMGRRTLWWGGCAWDAFALPHLIQDESPVLVSTRCPTCSSAHAWNVGKAEPPAGDQVSHFLVPTDRMWDDVVHTCGHQRIFCSMDCVNTWLTETGNPLGYEMDLSTLWRLARHWYDGRLQRGYTRRDPAAAKEYFRSVGLDGKFWGL